MSGYMMCFGGCCNCQRLISFNAGHVPSLPVGPGGSREPLCADCFDLWNKVHRINKGLEPEPLHPKAYAPEEC